MTARERWALSNMARQLEVVESLVPTAGGSSDGSADCRSWLAVRRQVHTYLRHLGPWLEAGGLQLPPPRVLEHQAALEKLGERANLELEGHDDGTRRQARARLGVRAAFMGKGGSGKTMICATLARHLARQGRSVVVVDLDTNPGLSMSLGLAAGGEAGLPPEAVEAHGGANYGWHLAEGITPLEAVERYSRVGPDGVRVLAVGKIDSPDKSAAKRSVTAVLQILLGLGAPGWDVLADMEGGPTTPFERYHSFADDVMVIVGPAWRSAMTARRLLPMVGDRNARVVANRFDDEPDHPGLIPQVRIPFDPCVAEAERQGRAPFDACPSSPAMQAIAGLGDLVLDQQAPMTQEADA
ncbi:MAG: AAA family ATPase [Acidimicrobiales bacterium]